MAKSQPQEKVSEHDRLVSRPGDPLPTPLDPAGPESRGAPADPKREPPGGQGTDPHAGDIDYTA